MLVCQVSFSYLTSLPLSVLLVVTTQYPQLRECKAPSGTSLLIDSDLAGPETVSLDEIDAEFAALEEQKMAEQLRDPDGQEVLGGSVYDIRNSTDSFSVLIVLFRTIKHK